MCGSFWLILLVSSRHSTGSKSLPQESKREVKCHSKRYTIKYIIQSRTIRLLGMFEKRGICFGLSSILICRRKLNGVLNLFRKSQLEAHFQEY